MQTQIIIYDKKKEPVWLEEAWLDGLIPEYVINLMNVNICNNELGLCDNCDLNHTCYVLKLNNDGTFDKLCPILFVDIFKPKWKIKQLV